MPNNLESIIPLTEFELNPFSRQALKRNIVKEHNYRLFGSQAATAANYGNIFVPNRGYALIGASEVHRVAGSNGGAVTVTIEKCASGVAPDNGTILLATAFNLKSTANTPVHGTLIANKDFLIIKRGDRLVARDVGTLTDVDDVCITLYLIEL